MALCKRIELPARVGEAVYFAVRIREEDDSCTFVLHRVASGNYFERCLCHADAEWAPLAVCQYYKTMILPLPSFADELWHSRTE